MQNIIISNGHCGITLTPKELGVIGRHTFMDLKAGPFYGSLLVENVSDYKTFYNQLVSLHKSLKGEAGLYGEDPALKIVIKGDGKGHMTVAVNVPAENFPDITLAFAFEIDQTYLPKIIEALRSYL